MLITALAAGVVLVVGAIAFYLVLVRAPAEIAGNVAEGFREFFNFTPRVTIDQTVVIEQSTPIIEVSTLSRNLFAEDRWEDQWIGSTKTVCFLDVVEVSSAGSANEPSDNQRVLRQASSASLSERFPGRSSGRLREAYERYHPRA